ncbi:MAG: hypothetical protein PV344_03660, partial [Anaplasma sp.]|nr:hypothetical protein [Anaplasma sp.]
IITRKSKLEWSCPLRQSKLPARACTAFAVHARVRRSIVIDTVNDLIFAGSNFRESGQSWKSGIIRGF